MALKKMEGLGIKEEDPGNEQISMEMEREMRGMTGCSGGNRGQDRDGASKAAVEEQPRTDDMN